MSFKFPHKTKDVPAQHNFDYLGSKLTLDYSEWLKPQEIYGAGVAAALGGVAPATPEAARGFAGTVELYAAVAGDMRLSITPARNVWWRTRFHQGAASVGDAAWVRADWTVDLNGGSDARGRTSSTDSILTLHSALPYGTAVAETIWKLQAGVAYTARMIGSVVSGTAWSYWYGGSYFDGQAEVVGFW